MVSFSTAPEKVKLALKMAMLAPKMAKLAAKKTKFCVLFPDAANAQKGRSRSSLALLTVFWREKVSKILKKIAL